ncbi:MAG TPA: glycosyltransferase family 39 protein [Burkholderiaceae bacterium]
MRDLYKSKPVFWVLFVLFLIVWFYALGARTLVPSDEGRYAEMAREMSVTGDWITPRLDGLKYFEKPPLQTWMNALTFDVFGLGEWQARLWSGLCGLLGVALVFHTGRRVFNPWVGATAGIVLASSFWWAGLSHINVLDMGLSGMMALTLCGMLLAQRDDASAVERRNGMWLSWAGMALAFLSKGPIGIVLPGAVLVLYTLISRDWKLWLRLHLVSGLILFFAIAAPWFVLVTLKNPEYPYFFFVVQNYQRYISPIANRPGPIYYFVPMLIAGIVPWIGLLLQSLWAGRNEEAPTRFRPKLLLLLWAGFIFFFFSISSSKLPHYILPIFPALALLIACHLQRASARSWNIAAGLLALIAVAGLVFVPRLAHLGNEPQEIVGYAATQPWVVAACSIMLAASTCVFWLTKKKHAELATLATLALAAGGFFFGQLVILGTEAYGQYRAGYLLVPAISAELTPETTLYTIGTYEQSLPFYLRHTMVTVGETNDELDFGRRQEPQLGLKDVDAFIPLWNNGQKAIAIMRPKDYEELLQRGVKMRIVAQDPRRIVVTNQ